MARLDIERQEKMEPLLIKRAISELKKLGIEGRVTMDEKAVQFMYKHETVTYWPYSGWHSGQSIKDGRGFYDLFNQLKGEADG